MNVTCPSCTRNMSIPDEQLPDAPRFKVKCPGCGTEAVVEKQPQAAPAPSASTVPQTEPHEAPPRRTLPPEALPDLEPENHPSDISVAFVHVTSPWKDVCEEFFRDKGWVISNAESPEEAVAKLRLNRYEAVVIADDAANEAIQAEVDSWPGLRRRDVFCLLVGESGESRDPAIAFYRAADMYCNAADSASASELLKSGYGDFRALRERMDSR